MKRYPYPEKRIYLSAVIAGLSIILALALLSGQPILTGYYFFSTVVFTVITFLLKKHLYTFILTERNEDDTSEGKEHTPWKAMLIIIFMSLASIIVPLLLAGILSGPIWFTMIVSFTSGVSISEIVLYLQMRQ